MELAHIDFEVFSPLNVKTHGAARHAEPSEADVLCMASLIREEDPSIWLPGDPPPEDLRQWVENGGLVTAWNAEYEMEIWNTICVKRMGWFKIPFKQWRDTAAIALSLAFPASLEKTGEALGLDILKDKRGKHLLNKLCQPRRPSKHNSATRWTPESAPEDFHDLYEYCKQDVRAERAIHQALPIDDLPPKELAIWRMTVKMNRRGWLVDLQTAERVLKLLADHKERALAETAALTDYEITSPNQIAKCLEWLRRDQGVT